MGSEMCIRDSDYAAEFDHGLDLVLGALSPDEVTS